MISIDYRLPIFLDNLIYVIIIIILDQINPVYIQGSPTFGSMLPASYFTTIAVYFSF